MRYLKKVAQLSNEIKERYFDLSNVWNIPVLIVALSLYFGATPSRLSLNSLVLQLAAVFELIDPWINFIQDKRRNLGGTLFDPKSIDGSRLAGPFPFVQLFLFSLLVVKEKGHALQQLLLPGAHSDGMKAKLSGDQVVGLEFLIVPKAIWLWIREFPSLDPDLVELDFLSLTLPIRKSRLSYKYNVTDRGVYLSRKRIMAAWSLAGPRARE